MATNWPSSVQTFTNPTSGSSLSSPSHADQHATINDTVEALQTYAGLVFVKSVTIGSGVSSVTVTDAFPSAFRSFQIVGDIYCATNNTTLLMQLSGITGTAYDSVVYYNTFGSSSAESVAPSNNATSWDIGHWRYGGSMFLQNVNVASFKMYNFGIVSDVSYMRRGGGRCQSTDTATGFTITPAIGTINGGKLRIYGFNNG